MGPRSKPRSPRAGVLRLAVLLGLAGLASGCGALPRSPTMASVPPEWRRTNPWGPEANAARARGELRPLFYTPQMAAWADFGRRHIRHGDILFRRGRSNQLVGKLSGAVISGVSDSRFTHDSIACWEGDTLLVYDAQPAPEGVRKIPFEFWMLDTTEGTLAVRRLRPPFQASIPAALAFIEDAYQRQVPFDTFLHLDDDKLYCSEMIEKAFRSTGLVLSDPVPSRCLPKYPRYSPLRPLVEALTSFRVDEPVFAMGNDHYGIYASPCLETVYGEDGGSRPGREPRPPRCPPVPYPPRAP